MFYSTQIMDLLTKVHPHFLHELSALVSIRISYLHFQSSSACRLWSLELWPKPDSDRLSHWHLDITVCPTAEGHRPTGIPAASFRAPEAVPLLWGCCAPCTLFLVTSLHHWKSTGLGCGHLSSPNTSSAWPYRVYFGSFPLTLPNLPGLGHMSYQCP